MTRIREAYDKALEKVNSGAWAINFESGTVYGRFGRPLTARNSYGYPAGTIDVDGKRHEVSFHRVVWEAAWGKIPEGMQINHKNGIKADNSLWNLELVTPAENTEHALSIGLRPRIKTLCRKKLHQIQNENLLTEGSGTRRCRKCRNAGEREHRGARSR